AQLRTFALGEDPAATLARALSPGEARLRQPPDAAVEADEPARLRLPGEVRVREAGAGGGDVEGGKILAAEHAARRLRDRHRHHPVDPAVGRVADEAPATPMRVPEEALGVHRRAVRTARLAVHVGEDPAVPDRAG